MFVFGWDWSSGWLRFVCFGIVVMGCRFGVVVLIDGVILGVVIGCEDCVVVEV